MKKTLPKKKFFTPMRIVMLSVSVIIIVILSLGLYLDGKNIPVLQPQGIIAEKEKSLLVFTAVLGLFVIIPVFIMLFTFAYKYRASNTSAKYTPETEGSKLLETVWWGIPIIIIAILSVVTWFSSHDLDPYKSIASSNAPLKVQVVSLQWRWLFIYPDQKIATVNELRIPEKTPIEFDITGDSAMSAFWIPSLGSQTYAMNGMTSKLTLEASETGEFRGSNSNISGEGYADMNFKVIAMKQDDFKTWASTLSTSNKGLDMATYEQLATPHRDKSVMYYALSDESIMQSVINKYMQHDPTMEMTDDQMVMDHSTMNHEGMMH